MNIDLKVLKKYIFLLFIFITNFAFCNETEIEYNLTNHLSFFTSKELNGRKSGTQYAQKVADYIYEQFDKLG